MRKFSRERGFVVVDEYRGRVDDEDDGAREMREPERRAGYDLPAGHVNAPIDVAKVGRIQSMRIMVPLVDGIPAAWKSKKRDDVCCCLGSEGGGIW